MTEPRKPLRRQRGINPTYWNVGGVPVSALPQPEGEMSVRAWDVPEGRAFALKTATEIGVEISEAEFAQLKKNAQRRA